MNGIPSRETDATTFAATLGLAWHGFKTLTFSQAVSGALRKGDAACLGRHGKERVDHGN